MIGAPRISVVVPFRDRIPWLEEAVQSVVAQSFGDFELILVDDGSAGKAEFLRGLRDDRVRYVREAQRGAGAARNRGMELARGAYLAFLDSDDLFLPEKLEIQMAAMESDPSAAFSHTSYIRIGPDGAEIGPVPSGRFTGRVYPGIVFRCPIATSTVMVRRDALGDLRFPEGVASGEDIVLWARVARSRPILGLDRPLTRVRVCGHNAYISPETQYRGNLVVLRHAFAEDSSFPAGFRRDELARVFKRWGHWSLSQGEKRKALACFLQALVYRPMDREPRDLVTRLLLPERVKAPLRRLRNGLRGEVDRERPATPAAVRRIVVVSHVLPPSRSGQAVALYRLLHGWPAEGYCLASRERHHEMPDEGETGRLAGRHHHLRPVRPFHDNRFPIVSDWVFRRHAGRAIEDRGREIASIAREEGCSLVVGCTGDLHDLPAASLAARLAGLPFVAHIFDDYAFQWTGRAREVAARIEHEALESAAAIVVPNEFLRREYSRRYGVDSEVIPNPCTLPDLDRLDTERPAFDPLEIPIVYAGAVYHAHFDAFRNLLAAIERLGRRDVTLHLFTSQSVNDLRTNGIEGPRVIHHPSIEPSEVPKVLRQASLLFLPLAFNSPIPEVVRTSAPGKTGEYLSVARPILVHAPEDSFLSWYFRENGCGFVVDRNDPDAVLEALEHLLGDEGRRTKLGTRARECAESDFDERRIAPLFEDLMRKIATGCHDGSR